MLGLWIENKQMSLRQDIELQTGPNEVEVKVKLAGICGTDLELLRGYYNFSGVPGHEFVAEVVTSGQWFGKRVVADINFGCGSCAFCKIEVPHHCLERRTLGINQAIGAFTQYTTIPLANLIAVPDSVLDEHAVLAEPLAAALQIHEQIQLAGKRVLLVGAGRLGRMIAHVISLREPSTDLTIGVRNPTRVRQMPESASVVAIEDLTVNTSRKFDVAIDCTGNAAGFAIALDALKAKGQLVVKSTYADRLNIDMSRIVVDEITIVGSRCGPMQLAVDFLEQHASAFRNMKIETYSLANYETAFARARESDLDKVLFRP